MTRGTAVMTLVVAVSGVVLPTATRGQETYTHIYNYYSPSREDNFATANPAWAGSIGDTRSPDYRLFRIEGMLFHPDRPQPPGTVPVFTWYSPGRRDNYMTSRWSGEPGSTRSPDYRFVRLAGYAFDPGLPPPQGAVPLYSWYDEERQDNLATTDRVYAGVKGASNRSPNYRYVRREGYVLPYHPRPDIARLTVPVYFHFQEEYLDSESGLPAFDVVRWVGRPPRAVTEPRTMLDFDQALEELNAAVDSARGLDGRRLSFARAGVRYFPTPAEDPERMVSLYQWWSANRGDHFATTNADWRIQGVDNEMRSPDYRPAGKVALLYRPERERPPGTVPVYSWYSPSRGDNFATSDPAWRGTRGDTRAPDYRFVRVEGFIYDPQGDQPPGTVPLHSWYNPERGDNLISSKHGWWGSRGDMRQGYRYVRKEGYAELPTGCDLLVSTLMSGAINVHATASCGGVADSPAFVRADPDSLAHELGHGMGLYHMFLGNQALATGELLYRELDPDNPDSCYVRGDRACDTPPDYGFANAEGVENPQCDNRIGVPLDCEQLGPPCDPQEPMVDGAGLCTNRDGQGARRYEAVPLGLQLGTPNNIMAYHNQDEFSYEQFLRMLDYGMWRAGLGHWVPRDERHVFEKFSGGPDGDSIWTASPGRLWQLSAAQRANIGGMAAWGEGPRWRNRVSTGSAARLLSFRVELVGTGTPSSEIRLEVSFPDGSNLILGEDSLLVEDGRIVFDEIYGFDLNAVRGRQTNGFWTVELRGGGRFSPDRVLVSILAE